MDVAPTLPELHAYKESIEKAIALLEEMQPHNNIGKARSRAFMGAEERLQVSRRKKRYWAKRGARDAKR